MNVIVGFEESGKVSREFRLRGHSAWSCDLQPSRGDQDHHIHGDIISHLNSVPDGYYDIGVFHVDCTKVAVSGNRWYGTGTPRHHERLEYLDWVEREFLPVAMRKCVRIAIENPVSVLFGLLKKYGFSVHYIQPWQFGHGETKKTGLATIGLPDLEPTDIVEGREQLIWKMPPGPNRKRDRSVTFDGIADAMAEQWGSC